MDFDLLHPSEQIAAIMSRIYAGGMTTTSGGNLSIRDENGDTWITPKGVDKGALTPKDIVRVGADGKVEGLHAPSSEHPFHRAIYARRPDLAAIIHGHPPALVAFSVVRQTPATEIIPQAQRVCGPVGYAPYEVPGSEALGQSIARAFEDRFDAVIMENHGTVVAGTSLSAAFQRFETLEFCARTLIRTRQIGAVQALSAAEIARFEHQDNLLS
jgi:L-fuculose-phosphate aldolase